MSWLFPHLDPWGIGAFYEPRRKIPLSITDQLSHILRIEGNLFERDPEFAFVYFNIIQKKTVFDNVRFTVPTGLHESITRELLSINVDEIKTLEDRFKADPSYQPVYPAEKHIMKLLGRVNLVGHNLPGTAAYKVKLRNEIRAMMNFRGTATIFATINPSDVKNPIVRLLTGEDIDIQDAMRGDDLDDWHRNVLVADNPGSCAVFFDTMVKKFLDIILRYGRDGKGIFGKCVGYYGTVEAQGKGTLHLHLLIWLEGHPSPQGLRDRMEHSAEYKDAMINWLESIIRCELMGTDEVVVEPPGVIFPRPHRGAREDHPHPGTVAQPLLSELGREDFNKSYIDFVNQLLEAYNWHEHNSTCWKYLKRGKPPDENVDRDRNCRMRMNGKTNPKTYIDEDTRSIVLRRLHPRIAAYNDVLIFLLQCNVDVKFIGSGEAAKALLYYCTDYITKPSLPTHVGLGALQYAIKRTNEKASQDRKAEADESVESGGKAPKSALVTLVNGLMGRQEISHQQVMSYLIGGGDHYTSEKFAILFWSPFQRLFANWFEEPYRFSRPAANNPVVDGNDGDAPVLHDQNTTNLEDNLGTGDGTNLPRSDSDPPMDVDGENNEDANQSASAQDDMMDVSDDFLAPRESVNRDEIDIDDNHFDGEDVDIPDSSDPLATLERLASVQAGRGEANSHINEEDDSPQLAVDFRSETDDAAHKDRCVLTLGSGSITATNQQYDYMYRTKDFNADSLCLYDFVGLVNKTRIPEQSQSGLANFDGTPIQIQNQGRMSSPNHPQYETHRMKFRRWDVFQIPVILGESISRRDRTEQERDDWARSMLILFKPWRHPQDLRAPNETWYNAFLEYEHSIRDRHLQIIRNMTVMSECKDARDNLLQSRQHQGKGTGNASFGPDFFLEEYSRRGGDDPDADEIDFVLNEAVDLESGDRNPDFDVLRFHVDKHCRQALEECEDRSVMETVACIDDSTVLLPQDIPVVDKHADVMHALSKNKRPQHKVGKQNKKKKTGFQTFDERMPSLAVTSLEKTPTHEKDALGDEEKSEDEIFQDAVESVISEMQLSDNEEQERAFRIVADHMRMGTEQLLMYIAGVGGTGKSHVIKSIVRLFEKVSRADQLMLGAPTGCAAIGIGGYTIHSLVMLSRSGEKPDYTLLKALWAGVKYLIVDEVSMIGAHLLDKISDRLRQAKGDEYYTDDVPFGGLNIIFTGDFGQLEPVKQKALYAFDLVDKPQYSGGSNNFHVRSLYGAYLWRKVNTVVTLTKNQRQKNDPWYTEFLARLRVGNCTDTRSMKRAGGKELSDVAILRERDFSTLWKKTPAEAHLFRDAPIIVGSTALRDALNLKKSSKHAKRLGRTLEFYHSKDVFSRKPVESGWLQRAFWNMASSKTESHLGKLPLFVGMKVMITANEAISKSIVNGTEGIVHSIKYTTDDDGHRFADVVYVRVEGSGRFADDLDEDIVPIFPMKTTMKFQTARGRRSATRTQMPLIPAYCLTDYKSQGRSLDRAIVDLGSARSLQGMYVMLSRVRSLRGLAILRWFPDNAICGKRLSQQLRRELDRIDKLNVATKELYLNRTRSR